MVKYVEVESGPELKYAASGLEICTLRFEGMRHIAFGSMAVSIIDSVNQGDILMLSGHNKPWEWVDPDGRERTEDEFIIKRYEIVEAHSE